MQCPIIPDIPSPAIASKWHETERHVRDIKQSHLRTVPQSIICQSYSNSQCGDIWGEKQSVKWNINNYQVQWETKVVDSSLFISSQISLGRKTSSQRTFWQPRWGLKSQGGAALQGGTKLHQICRYWNWTIHTHIECRNRPWHWRHINLKH